MPSRDERSAFTIVEIVVVVMIVGILAAVAAPTFFQTLQHHQLESAARRVRLDLEQAQHVARVKSRGQSMTFTGTTYTLSSDVDDPDHAGGTYQVDLAASPFELDGAAIDFGGQSTVSFDGFGKPSAGGTIVLSRGDRQRTVTVDQDTGQVTITSE